MVMKPALMPHLSLSSLTMAAIELVVQEPAETMLSSFFQDVVVHTEHDGRGGLILGRGGR